LFQRNLRGNVVSTLHRFLVTTLLLALVAGVLSFLPLFGALGYEFSTTVAVFASFFGAWHGARAETFRDAVLQSVAMLVAPLLIIVLNGVRVRTCDYPTGFAFFALLPGVSALCGAACGFCCARILRAPLRVACLLILGSIVWGVIRFYRTPAIFGFDPFVGYFAGTLYDEDVAIPVTLLLARIMHLSFALGAVAVLSQKRVVGATLLVAGAALFMLRGPLALAPTGPDIERALGGIRETSHFRIVYQKGSIEEPELTLLAQDHEFRYAQLAAAIGVEPAGHHVTSFIFPSEESKKHWMGAGHTYIAKPWRREVYLQHDEFPHPVLKHELAHVFAGAFGDRMFHISARYWPPRINVGLIEGVAVALDWRPGRELSPAGYARALAELDMQPPLEGILGLGFLSYTGARAYTVAGAFCRYLLDNYGAAKLRALYRSAGDFAQVYGKPLKTLELEWRAQLAKLVVTERAKDLTLEGMRQPSIWHKVCPHTLAILHQRADDARGRGDVERAIQCVEEIIAVDPEEPQNLLTLADLRAAGGDFHGADQAAERAGTHANTSRTLRGHIEELRGDIAWRSHDEAAALTHYNAALTAPLEEQSQRTLEAKRVTLGDARLRGPLGRLFLGEPAAKSGEPLPHRDPSLDLYLAEAARQAAPTLGLPVYLLGRGLFLRGAFADALAPLERSLTLGLPSPLFVREALRTKGIAAYRTGALDVAQAAFEQLAKEPDLPEGTRLEADDWLARVAWAHAPTLPGGLRN
jgi:tetratricopeptide (TPR) repeat protein